MSQRVLWRHGGQEVDVTEVKRSNSFWVRTRRSEILPCRRKMIQRASRLLPKSSCILMSLLASFTSSLFFELLAIYAQQFLGSCLFLNPLELLWLEVETLLWGDYHLFALETWKSQPRKSQKAREKTARLHRKEVRFHRRLDLCLQHGDFPQLCQRLPKGNSTIHWTT